MNQKIKSINFVLSILRLRINLPYYRSFVIPMKWTFKDKPRLYRTSYISKYLLRSLGLRYIRVLLYIYFLYNEQNPNGSLYTKYKLCRVYCINLVIYNCFPVKTKITNPPQDVKVIKGSTTVVQCGVLHDPNVTVHWLWYLENNRIEPSTDIRRQIREDGSLEIQSVRNEDIGTFRCDVYSTGGNDTADAELTIIGRTCYVVLIAVDIFLLYYNRSFKGWKKVSDN